jgi:hypothetical protein
MTDLTTLSLTVRVHTINVMKEKLEIAVFNPCVTRNVVEFHSIRQIRHPSSVLRVVNRMFVSLLSLVA